MKDWVKTTIWVVICFCLVSAFIGIFELFSFLQLAGQRVQNIGIGNETRTYFTANTAVDIVCAVASITMIVVTAIVIAKGGKNKKLIIVLLAVVLATSVLLAVFPFFTIEILKNREFAAVRYDGMIYYAEFTHYQAFLSATLSTFLPIMISAGAILGYYLFNAKKQEATQSNAPETATKE